jgi:HAD superfamily hydrolase (TIGR01509 family)
MTDIALDKVLKGRKGVFFDMDGVLYDSMGAHADAWSNAFRHFGIDFPPEMVYLNEGRTAQSTINLVFQQNEDRKATDSEVKMIYAKKTELIEVFPDAIPFEGALVLMELLKGMGLDIWVVTGSSQDKFLEPLLRDFRRFISADRLITGRDVKHGKPNPEPYLKALYKSGWEPTEVIVIENAPLGIQSAKAAGIYTIAVNSGILDDKVLWDSGADVVINKLTELISEL